MLPYLVTFTICAFLIYIADNKRILFGRIKISRYIIIAIAVFFPCFLAAVRDSTVGTDVLIYSDRLFQMASKYDNLYEYYKHADTDWLFGALAFGLGHIGNRYLYYFVLQLLTIGPIVLAMGKLENRKYNWVGILVYLLLFFPFSLNIMRQSIAISLLVYAYQYIKERNIKKYGLMCLLATGFHSTAVIGILFYILHILLGYEYNTTRHGGFLRRFFRKYRFISKCLILFGSIAIVFSATKILDLIVRTTGLYAAQYQFLGAAKIEVINVVIMLMLLLLIVYLKDSQNEIDYLLFVILIGTILYQLKATLSQMYRVSQYFTAFLTLVIPTALSTKKSKNVPIVVILILVICCFDFWYYLIYRSWHAVIPYTSSFLGIN